MIEAVRNAARARRPARGRSRRGDRGAGPDRAPAAISARSRRAPTPTSSCSTTRSRSAPSSSAARIWWRRNGRDLHRAADEGVLRRRVVAVDDVTLRIEDGEFMVLVGPSGCGKSTLLRTIAGLEEATAGTIWIGGRDVTDLAAARARRRDGLPELRALPAHDRPPEPRLRAQGAEDVEGRDREAGRARWRGCCGSRSCSTGDRPRSPAASASGSRWGARSCASRWRS